MSGEPASLDPAGAIDSFSKQIVKDLYEGLTDESPEGDVLPGVASAWKVDSTGTQYTFTIRDSARWSNGQPILAHQFVDAWQRVLDPKTASPLSNDLQLIVGASSIISGLTSPTTLGAIATTDKELTVTIVRPAAFFPQLLAHPAAFPIFSEASARARTKDKWVSNGPFVLADWRPDSAFELTKNNNYWNSNAVQIQKVKYLISSDANAQLSAYRSGQIDMTDTVPANAAQEFRVGHPNEVVIAPYLCTAFYSLNVTSEPLSKSLKLRKALAMSIDRSKLIESLALGQVAAFGFVPPGTLNYEPQSWDWKSLPDQERIAEAKRLYAEAGYSSRRPLRLRLLLNSSVTIKQTALLIAAMWKQELGIETIIVDEEFRVFLQSRGDRSKWEVARLAWNADYNDASSFLDIFRSESPNNDSGFKSSSYDDLLEKAGATQDVVRRGKILEEAEREMIENYPIIPLYFFVSKRLVKPFVHGVHPNPLDRVETKNLTIGDH